MRLPPARILGDVRLLLGDAHKAREQRQLDGYPEAQLGECCVQACMDWICPGMLQLRDYVAGAILAAANDGSGDVRAHAGLDARSPLPTPDAGGWLRTTRRRTKRRSGCIAQALLRPGGDGTAVCVGTHRGGGALRPRVALFTDRAQPHAPACGVHHEYRFHRLRPETEGCLRAGAGDQLGALSLGHAGRESDCRPPAPPCSASETATGRHSTMVCRSHAVAVASSGVIFSLGYDSRAVGQPGRLLPGDLGGHHADGDWDVYLVRPPGEWSVARTMDGSPRGLAAHPDRGPHPAGGTRPRLLRPACPR